MLRLLSTIAILLVNSVVVANFGLVIEGPCTKNAGCEYNYEGMKYNEGIYVAPYGWDGKMTCAFNEWYHVEAIQSWNPGKKWKKYCKNTRSVYFICESGTCMCHMKVDNKGKEIEKEECKLDEWCLTPHNDRARCFEKVNPTNQCDDERGCACQTTLFGNELLICAKSQFCNPGISSPGCWRGNADYWVNREFLCKVPSETEIAEAKKQKDKTLYNYLLRKKEQIQQRGCRCSTQIDDRSSYCKIGQWCKLRGLHNHCNDAPKYHDPVTKKVYEDNKKTNPKKRRSLEDKRFLI